MVVVSLAGGLLVLAGTMFRHRLETRFAHFPATVSLIEGIMCGLVGVAAARRGTSYIQDAWLVAAVAFVVAAVVKLVRADRSLPRSPESGVAAPEQTGGQ